MANGWNGSARSAAAKVVAVIVAVLTIVGASIVSASAGAPTVRPPHWRAHRSPTPSPVTVTPTPSAPISTPSATASGTVPPTSTPFPTASGTTSAIPATTAPTSPPPATVSATPTATPTTTAPIATASASVSPSAPPTSTPAAVASPATPTGLKPNPVGLYANVGARPRGGVPGVFVNVPWSALEPADQSFTGPGWSLIASALADPYAQGIKIRVMAGAGTPEWLQQDVGEVSVDTECCGRISIAEYWMPEYQVQYQQLMQELARRYDSNPRVLSVSNSACMTANAEPFIKGGDAAGAELYAAGDNEANERYCFVTSMASQMQAFASTRVDLAGHLVWQIPTATGLERSWTKERDLVNSFLSTYGNKLLFQDNGLANQVCAASVGSSSATPTLASTLWCYMRSISGDGAAMTDIGFQRGCGDKVGTCSNALVLPFAVSLGACWFEHANFNDLTDQQVSDFNAQLQANPGCSP